MSQSKLLDTEVMPEINNEEDTPFGAIVADYILKEEKSTIFHIHTNKFTSCSIIYDKDHDIIFIRVGSHGDTADLTYQYNDEEGWNLTSDTEYDRESTVKYVYDLYKIIAD